jgi:hypothetical protein
MCPRGAPESASRNAAAGAVTRLRVGADPTRTRGWVLGSRRIVCESVRKSLAFREENAERESRETAYGVPAGSSRGHAGRYDRGNRRSSAMTLNWDFRSHPRMRFSGGRPLFPAFSQSSRVWARVRLRRAKRSSGVVFEAVRRARERGTMLPQVCHVMTARGVVALGPSLSFPLLPSSG